MAALAKWYAALKGGLATTGSANAYVLTTGSSHATLAAIGLVVFRANHTNTGASTLAVDGLAAKSLYHKGSAIASGTLVQNTLYAAVYNATNDVFDIVSITQTSPDNPAILGTPTSGNLSNCTADGTNVVGFRHIPQNSQSADYTLVLADAGKHILHPAADISARTFTIPANSSVAFPVGTSVTFINENGAGTVTIAITTDTMRLAGTVASGSRTLAANGIATAVKITSTSWIISGSGLN